MLFPHNKFLPLSFETFYEILLNIFFRKHLPLHFPCAFIEETSSTMTIMKDESLRHISATEALAIKNILKGENHRPFNATEATTIATTDHGDHQDTASHMTHRAAGRGVRQLKERNLSDSPAASSHPPTARYPIS